MNRARASTPFFLPRLAIVGLAILLAVVLAACPAPTPPEVTMDDVATSYVKLVLAMGLHDADYVDAYFGPPAWRQEVEAESLSLEEIAARTAELQASLAGPASEDEGEASRRRHLASDLVALQARIDLLAGRTRTFDEESRALYDAVAPTHSALEFEETLAALEAALPGEGTLIDRYSAFRADFVIPPERLDAVFQAAIDACRERTRAHLDLPAGESFEIEYVTGKSWSAYNWYKGDYHSLIQVNTDLPIHIDRALDLACHEGYPGHHVYNLLLERELVNERGWVEYAVYPLFSPRSLIAEGTANFGIAVAFPDVERQAFEGEVLFPAAGLDPARVDDYYRVQELVERLGYAGNEAARRYLDGEIDAAAAAEWLTRYAMMPPDRAAQRVHFIDQYRSYVINYNLGQDLVRSWVEARGGTADDPERRWREFADLLSRPVLPSELE